MPPSFGDLYKPVKDLLNKKYNGDSHKVDIKAVDGVTFNPVFTRKGDKVDGTVSVEGKYDPCAWASMKLKYTIATAGNLTTKMTVSKMAPGLVVEGNWDAAMGDDVSKDKYDAKATYTADAGNCELKVVKGKTQTAELSGVYGVMKDVNLGASMMYNLAGGQESMGFSGAYTLSKQTTAAFMLNRKGSKDTLTAGFVQKGSPYTIAAQYETALSDPKNGSIIVGCERKLEGGQIVKAKATSGGAFALSLQHALSKEFNLCASMDVTGGKSKFGTELIYTA